MKERKIANFEIEKEMWDKFVYHCRKNNTTAAAQLRLYVSKFFIDEVEDEGRL